MWQNDLLGEQSQEQRWCHRFRGEGGVVLWRQEKDKFSKWKEEGLTVWPSHHTMLVGCGGAKRFTAEGNFSKLWVSHPAPDALIHDSDPVAVTQHPFCQLLL